MEAHGLNLSFKGEILNSLISHNIDSKFEGYIDIENLNDNSKIVVPMRSFVIKFIDILQKMFSGTGDSTTRKSSVSWSGSTARRAGLIIGNGTNPVVLSDTQLSNIIASPTVGYGNTTIIAPYVVTGNPNQIITEIRKVFTNNSSSNLTISEIGLSTKPIGASTASTGGVSLLSRDLLNKELDTIGVTVTAGNSIRFTFKFKVVQESNGYGGINLNFVKLIHNLLFKGDQNSSNSLLVNYLNQSINNYTYDSTAISSSTAPWYLNGTSTQPYIGIVLGTRYDEEQNEDEGMNPSVSADERIMKIKALTYDNNTISAVTNTGTNQATFTISRNITNNTGIRTLINRVGLLIRGSGTGTVLDTKQVFIAIKKIDNTYLEPGQTYRATFRFSIQS